MSELADNDSNNDRDIANHNFELIKIFKKINIEHLNILNEYLYLEQMSCLTYYEFKEKDIEIIRIE